ncbi:Ribosome-recycling factor [Glycine max]|nr:Ribosome-recycling factor [Glycine max]
MVIGLYVLEDEGGVGTIEVPPNVGPTIKANAVSQMEAAMAALAIPSEQATYRKGIPRSSLLIERNNDGHVSTGMLDHIIVETSGLKMPLNWLVVVFVLDQKTLQRECHIVSSPLGLNPKSDGERLIAAMTKLVAKSCEDASQSIRRAQQKAMDAIKKLYSSLPKDDIKRLEKEVDDLTKKISKTAEDVCKVK